ncbi:MAG TPA: FGGY family carbohydrate kinase [Patescibacteria group bacterium]|nr:FGGY family carbohydrate kinase [Patescibacteria group bacterium]
MARPGGEGLLLAVDVGTSGARAAAFDLDGHRLVEARRGYPTRTPAPGRAEQDGRAWRSAALGAVADLVRRLARDGYRPTDDVRAIGLTGQCPSVVLVDGRGEPVSPGLIYRDNRASPQADAIRERFGDAAIHRRTGHLPTGFHIAPKLLWLRDHEPAVFARAALALQPRDLVALALTGEAATDGTHAAATLVYDLRGGDWDGGLLADLGLDRSLFPAIGRSDGVVGGLRPGVAARLGLPAGTPVVLGGADSQACALGVGVVDPGPVSEMAGSSTCLNAAVPEPLDVLAVTHYPHVVPGPFTTETGINTTGAAVAWLAGLLFGGRAGRPTSADFDRLDAEASAVDAGADGVVALPVLGDGERTDPDLRGAFVGLSLRHGRAALARAVLEGVAFAMADQLDLLRAGGAPVIELRVSGGDTRLATWTGIKADILGIPVRTVPGDAAVTGVAMLAGLGAGLYRDPAEAIARCVRLGPAREPDPRTAAAYDQAGAAYHELAGSTAVRAASPSEGG